MCKRGGAADVIVDVVVVVVTGKPGPGLMVSKDTCAGKEMKEKKKYLLETCLSDASRAPFS
jgi:hypothetical protein